VLGVETNLPLLSSVLASPEFGSGAYDTGLVGRLPARAAGEPPDAAWVAAAAAFQNPRERGGLSAETSAKAYDPWADGSGWRPLA